MPAAEALYSLLVDKEKAVPGQANAMPLLGNGPKEAEECGAQPSAGHEGVPISATPQPSSST